MGLTLTHIKGENPLDEDDLNGLLIKSISNKRELDEFEQQNIESAILYFKNKRNMSLDYFLSEKFFKSLHKKMFSNVWDWAGKLRKSDKSIGVDWSIISVEIKKLLDDCSYWIENKARDVYLKALKRADNGSYEDLINFAKS